MFNYELEGKAAPRTVRWHERQDGCDCRVHLRRDVYNTNPAINELVVTSDGFVLVEHVGEVGANDMIGGESDLQRNWNNLLDVAGLTPEERIEAEAAYQAHVRSFRIVNHPKSEWAFGTQPAKRRPVSTSQKG